MAGSQNSRKKALFITLFIFLAAGGGIFTYFVFQGLGDFKGGGKGDFHYGFNVKGALTPLFNYFSRTDADAELARDAKKRLEARGLDVSLLDGTKPDISDWMSKGGGARGSSRAAGSRVAPAARTPIPRMGAGLGGLPQGGGGGSQTSAGLSGFAGPGGSGTTGVSKTEQGARPAASGRGTLAALGGARAALSEGLQSGSAMAAKSKWDQSFAAGAPGKSGGALAYGKSGLVNLDRIKSGDIEGLKTTDPGSLKLNEPGAPQTDKAGEALMNRLDSMRSLNEDMARTQQIMANAAAGAGSPYGRSLGNTGQRKGDMPPPGLVAAASAGPPAGKFCTAACDAGDGARYTDSSVSYEKVGNPPQWQVSYEGMQKGPDGKVTYYRDTMAPSPNGDGTFIPVSSMAGNSLDNMQNVCFGCAY